MSNYSKPERPEGTPPEFYPEAEVVNGTGGTRVTVHDSDCEQAGGHLECCSGDLMCTFIGMDWRQMEALAWWMLEQANIARWTQLKETYCGRLNTAATGRRTRAGRRTGDVPGRRGRQNFRPANQSRPLYECQPPWPVLMESAFAMYWAGFMEQ